MRRATRREIELLTPEARALVAKYRRKLLKLSRAASLGEKDAALKHLQTMTEEAVELKKLGFRHNDKARPHARWEVIADMTKAMVAISYTITVYPGIAKKRINWSWRGFIQVPSHLNYRVIEVRPTKSKLDYPLYDDVELANLAETYKDLNGYIMCRLDAMECLKSFGSLNTEWISQPDKGVDLEKKIAGFIKKISKMGW